ncbi:hypothetical protein HK096_004059 [Nowakowskiella sp. JEL0078]|nr:hypothetical protein HK096_004059 [Nowakowskiella sp. JEL0078]
MILFPFGKRTVIFHTRTAASHILEQSMAKAYRKRFATDDGLRALGMLHRGLIWNNNLESWGKVRGCFQDGLSNANLKQVPELAKQFVDLSFSSYSKGLINTLDSFRLPRKDTWELAEDLITSVVNYFKAWEFFLVRPFWFTRMSRNYHQHLAASQKLHLVCEDLLKEYESLRTDKKSRPDCILDYAYHLYQISTFSREELIQLILESLLAGVDTSSVTMFYTLSFLAENDLCYEKVKNETDNFSSNINASSLVYLQACIRESMRLKPVGPIIMRQADLNDLVDGININQGDQIVINLAAMNILHGFTGDEKPFLPERFISDDKIISASILEFGHYPFGAGPKGCVGQHLAMREMQATLHYFLKNYLFHKPPTRQIEQMVVHWDIANQPQNKEDMRMFVISRLPIYEKRFTESKSLNIFLIGPQSTGKTFMLGYLEKRLGKLGRFHSEVARNLMLKLNLSGEDLNSDLEIYMRFQKNLLSEHASLMNLLTKVESKHTEIFNVFDRSSIDVIAYSLLRGGKENMANLLESQEFKECLKIYQNKSTSLIVLFPIIDDLLNDDGIRIKMESIEHQNLSKCFIQILEQQKIPYFTLSTNLKKRGQELLLEIYKQL